MRAAAGFVCAFLGGLWALSAAGLSVLAIERCPAALSAPSHRLTPIVVCERAGLGVIVVTLLVGLVLVGVGIWLVLAARRGSAGPTGL